MARERYRNDEPLACDESRIGSSASSDPPCFKGFSPRLRGEILVLPFLDECYRCSPVV